MLFFVIILWDGYFVNQPCCLAAKQDMRFFLICDLSKVDADSHANDSTSSNSNREKKMNSSWSSLSSRSRKLFNACAYFYESCTYENLKEKCEVGFINMGNDKLNYFQFDWSFIFIPNISIRNA